MNPHPAVLADFKHILRSPNKPAFHRLFGEQNRYRAKRDTRTRKPLSHPTSFPRSVHPNLLFVLIDPTVPVLSWSTSTFPAIQMLYHITNASPKRQFSLQAYTRAAVSNGRRPLDETLALPASLISIQHSVERDNWAIILAIRSVAQSSKNWASFSCTAGNTPITDAVASRTRQYLVVGICTRLIYLDEE